MKFFVVLHKNLIFPDSHHHMCSSLWLYEWGKDSLFPKYWSVLGQGHGWPNITDRRMNWRGWLIKETRYHLQFILLLQCLKLVNLQLGPQTEYRNIWLQLILIVINYSYISIITDLAHSQLKQEKLGVSTCMKEVDLCENIRSNFQAAHIVSILRLPHCVYIYQAKHELSNGCR